jgi:hypothetical protein
LKSQNFSKESRLSAVLVLQSIGSKINIPKELSSRKLLVTIYHGRTGKCNPLIYLLTKVFYLLVF